MGGGVLMDFGGNRAMVVGFFFFLFPIWVLGGWWWVVLGSGGWLVLTFSRNRFFTMQDQTHEIIFQCNFHNAIK